MTQNEPVILTHSDVLTIIFEKSSLETTKMWIASIPEIPGVFSQGSTINKARSNVIDALNGLSATRREIALSKRFELCYPCQTSESEPTSLRVCPHTHHERVAKADEMCPICTYDEIEQMKNLLSEIRKLTK